MTNRPFHEMPPIQCPVCGRAARVLVCEETRPPTGPAKGGEGWTVAGRLVSLVSCIVGSGSGVCGCAAPARAAGLAVVADGVSTIRLKTARIASAAQARQRLRRPSLRSGPPGDPHGPLRLKQHLGPEGALPARQDGPETS